MRRRVVVTGIGCITPLGATVDGIWNGLTEGRSGTGRLSLFDASNYPVNISAEVKDWDMSDVGEHPRQWEHCPRHTRFVVGAGIKAVNSSGVLASGIDPRRLGVYLGCGEAFEDFPNFMNSINAASEDGEFHADQFASKALRIFDPETEREYEPNTPASRLAALFNAQGPNANCISACVSAAQAIGEATRSIRRGEADVMLAGGAHSTIHPFGLTGFHRLSALSTNNDNPESAVRPFDNDRDGFVMGEGGAILVLEDLDHALARSADIWGELAGYGSAQDAYRVTDSHPEGRGTSLAIGRALQDASLNTDDISYVNAHGTGTLLNDRIETLAIKKSLGADAYRVPISSSKSMLGHSTTACGAIELAIGLMALRFQVAPPTINYQTPDPECDLDYIPNIARNVNCKHVLSQNIGFGGQNAALIVSQYNEHYRSSVTIRRAA